MAFHFHLQEPPCDVAFLSLVDGETLYNAKDASTERIKAATIQQIGWHRLALPEEWFLSTGNREQAEKVMRTLQCTLQYMHHKLSASEKNLAKSMKLAKSFADERDAAFEELVELRELVALQRKRLLVSGNEHVARDRHPCASDAQGVPKKSGTGASHPGNGKSGLACTLCGNAYPTTHALQSHYTKRHKRADEYAMMAASSAATNQAIHAQTQLLQHETHAFDGQEATCSLPSHHGREGHLGGCQDEAASRENLALRSELLDVRLTLAKLLESNEGQRRSLALSSTICGALPGVTAFQTPFLGPHTFLTSGGLTAEQGGSGEPQRKRVDANQDAEREQELETLRDALATASKRLETLESVVSAQAATMAKTALPLWTDVRHDAGGVTHLPRPLSLSTGALEEVYSDVTVSPMTQAAPSTRHPQRLTPLATDGGRGGGAASTRHTANSSKASWMQSTDAVPPTPVSSAPHQQDGGCAPENLQHGPVPPQGSQGTKVCAPTMAVGGTAENRWRASKELSSSSSSSAHSSAKLTATSEVSVPLEPDDRRQGSAVDSTLPPFTADAPRVVVTGDRYAKSTGTGASSSLAELQRSQRPPQVIHEVPPTAEQEPGAPSAPGAVTHHTGIPGVSPTEMVAAPPPPSSRKHRHKVDLGVADKSGAAPIAVSAAPTAPPPHSTKPSQLKQLFNLFGGKKGKKSGREKEIRSFHPDGTPASSAAVPTIPIASSGTPQQPSSSSEGVEASHQKKSDVQEVADPTAGPEVHQVSPDASMRPPQVLGPPAALGVSAGELSHNQPPPHDHSLSVAETLAHRATAPSPTPTKSIPVLQLLSDDSGLVPPPTSRSRPSLVVEVPEALSLTGNGASGHAAVPYPVPGTTVTPLPVARLPVPSHEEDDVVNQDSLLMHSNTSLPVNESQNVPHSPDDAGGNGYLDSLVLVDEHSVVAPPRPATTAAAQSRPPPISLDTIKPTAGGKGSSTLVASRPAVKDSKNKASATDAVFADSESDDARGNNSSYSYYYYAYSTQSGSSPDSQHSPPAIPTASKLPQHQPVKRTTTAESKADAVGSQLVRDGARIKPPPFQLNPPPGPAAAPAVKSQPLAIRKFSPFKKKDGSGAAAGNPKAVPKPSPQPAPRNPPAASATGQTPETDDESYYSSYSYYTSSEGEDADSDSGSYYETESTPSRTGKPGAPPGAPRQAVPKKGSNGQGTQGPDRTPPLGGFIPSAAATATGRFQMESPQDRSLAVSAVHETTTSESHDAQGVLKTGKQLVKKFFKGHKKSK